MRALLRNRIAGLVLRLILGAIFIYASHDKLTGSQHFADAVDNYHLLPRPILNAFAILLPWVELVTGMCLITGVLAPAGSLLSALLYAMFIAAMVSAISRGLNIDCGCFNLGAASEKVSWAHAALRVVGLIAGLVAFASSRTLDWPLAWLTGQRASAEHSER